MGRLIAPPTWHLVEYLCGENRIEIMLDTEGVKLYQDETRAVVGMLAREKIRLLPRCALYASELVLVPSRIHYLLGTFY